MTGDQADMLARLKAVLPRWFPDSVLILDGILSGLALAASLLYQVISYADLQVRIKTAIDGWLDLIAYDFFGAALVRTSGQSDESLRTRILINLLRERVTRAALVRVLTDVTGRAPIVIEPTRPADCGGYGAMGGYGSAGAYGSLAVPYWCFVQAFRPASSGIPFVAGYGSTPSGYSRASRGEYASLAMVQGSVTDADIYAAIEAVKPAGMTVWVNLSN
jgi:hypothetical protein